MYFYQLKNKRFLGGIMFNKVLFIWVAVIFSVNVWAKGSPAALCKSLFLNSSESLLKTDIDPAWVAEMSNREKLEGEQELMDLVRENAGKFIGEFNQKDHNSNYTHEIPKREVKNQCSAGSCWLFAGTNMLEGHLKAKGVLKNDFSFSQNYLYFFSLLERANVYFEKQIKMANKANLAEDIRVLMQMEKPSDGGVTSEFLYLVKKYGMVPNEAMPHTASSKKSQLILEVLNEYLLSKSSEMWMYIDQFKGFEFHNERFLQERGVKEAEVPEYFNKLQKEHFEFLRMYKQEVLSGAFKILESHLGTPPTQVEYTSFKTTNSGVQKALKAQTYTPKEFVSEVVKFNPEEFVTITDIPTRVKNKAYQAEFNSNIAKAHEGFKFLNLNTNRLVQLIKKTIDKGIPVYLIADFSADISHESGIMHPAVTNKQLLYALSQNEAPKLDFKKKSDWLYHLKGYANHAVIIDAYDKPASSKLPVKFRIENSWGEKAGEAGYYHMYLEWFLSHGYGIMVPKEMLTEREQKLWDGKVEYINDLMY